MDWGNISYFYGQVNTNTQQIKKQEPLVSGDSCYCDYLMVMRGCQ